MGKENPVREQTNLYLTIQNQPKGIPYGPTRHSDGTKNHGYKRLKGNSDLATSIPEAQEIDALKNALVRLNDPETAFFSVGCEKAYNESEKGVSITGYVELAFNFNELAGDAQHYFKLFFNFSGLLAQSPTLAPKVRYLFELQPAHFHDGPADGFTMSVWITTSLLPAREDAARDWGQALSVFVDFLLSFSSPANFTPIYSPGKQVVDL